MDNKINNGAIFKNERKEKDTQPDYKGGINVDGKEKDIALWARTSASGKTYFSVKVSDPRPAPAPTEPYQKVGHYEEEPNDLPF